MFGMTNQQLLDANPQWKGRPMLLTRLRFGEEIYLPTSIEKTTPFFLIHTSKLQKRRGLRPAVSPVLSAYPATWFPPKPTFGSPSNPLSTLLTKLGNPKYVVTNPGTYHSPIKFTDGWSSKNVSRVYIKALDGVPFYAKNGQKGSGSISFYTNAHKAIQDLFSAWDQAGLSSKILTFEGTYNPRVIGRSTTPSNHSFGTAFDINGSWNPQGKAPAGIGKEGCLLELVPIATQHKFYWGGFYSGTSVDGMHFEYAGL